MDREEQGSGGPPTFSFVDATLSAGCAAATHVVNDANEPWRHLLAIVTTTSATATCLIANELRTVALDAVDGLKDVDLMFGDEFVPGHADHAVDAAPTHAVSEQTHGHNCFTTHPLDNIDRCQYILYGVFD